MATAAQRSHALAIMQLLLAHQAQVHYPPNDVRGPLDVSTIRLSEQQLTTLLQHGGQVQMDCSESVELIFRLSGLLDPSGLGYAYPGTTWTMLAQLPHYTNPKIAKVAALVVFSNPAHVAIVMKPDPVHGDPALFSQGSEPGPFDVLLSDEARLHDGPVTFLSVARL